jgi:hypothetical protein
MLANYLSVEALITDRLKEPARSLPQVLSAGDLEGVKEASQKHPAIHLINLPDAIPNGKNDSAVNGKNQIVQQRWMVVIVVKNVSTSAKLREDAGPIISGAIKALQGWKPSPEHGHMLRKDAPYRQTYRNGFGYFPLLFTTQIITTGDQ